MSEKNRKVIFRENRKQNRFLFLYIAIASELVFFIIYTKEMEMAPVWKVLIMVVSIMEIAIYVFML